MSKWVELDYPGWERVNISEMKWMFKQPGIELDERSLKREEDGTWFITDDFGGWQEYGMCSDDDVIEELYQEWVTEQFEAIVL
jgi:hypothetical protein